MRKREKGEGSLASLLPRRPPFYFFRPARKRLSRCPFKDLSVSKGEEYGWVQYVGL